MFKSVFFAVLLAGNSLSLYFFSLLLKIKAKKFAPKKLLYQPSFCQKTPTPMSVLCASMQCLTSKASWKTISQLRLSLRLWRKSAHWHQSTYSRAATPLLIITAHKSSTCLLTRRLHPWSAMLLLFAKYESISSLALCKLYDFDGKSKTKKFFMVLIHILINTF